MGQYAIDLAGLGIFPHDLDSAIKSMERRIEQRRGGIACFVNTHTLTEASRDPRLRTALQSATYRFADGRPLLWLARAKGERIHGRVCGPDFMAAVLRRRYDLVHGFIGGKPGTAEQIAALYGVPHVAYSPPMRPFSPDAAADDWAQFLERCADRKPPSLVWVGLGAPKQELWMATVTRMAPETMFLGVGAAFDFLAQHIVRAPRFLQDVGLEWAHRLMTEPRRLWRRYLVSGSRFVQLAFDEIRGRPR